MSKTIKTEDFVTLRPSLIESMVKACQDGQTNALKTIFTELGENWRDAVKERQINDFFWDNGNAIVRM